MASLLTLSLFLAAQNAAQPVLQTAADPAPVTVSFSSVEGAAGDTQAAARAPAQKPAKAKGKKGFAFSTPGKGPVKGPLIGGIAALAVGLPGLASAVLLASGGALSMGYILFRYMDWEEGQLTFKSDTFVGVSESDRDLKNYEEALFQRILWNGGRYAITGAIFITMFSAVCVAVGIGLLGGWAVFGRE